MIDDRRCEIVLCRELDTIHHRARNWHPSTQAISLLPGGLIGGKPEHWSRDPRREAPDIGPLAVSILASPLNTPVVDGVVFQAGELEGRSIQTVVGPNGRREITRPGELDTVAGRLRVGKPDEIPVQTGAKRIVGRGEEGDVRRDDLRLPSAQEFAEGFGLVLRDRVDRVRRTVIRSVA